MSNVAPSCPINITQQKITTSQQMRTVNAASIPPAHDLPSVITAINAINNVVQQITRGEPQINNIVIRSPNPPTPPPTPPFNYADLRWQEVKRDYRDTQSVVNPDNPDQKIKIKMITRIKWLEDNTGHQLVYMGISGPIGRR